MPTLPGDDPELSRIDDITLVLGKLQREDQSRFLTDSSARAEESGLWTGWRIWRRRRGAFGGLFGGAGRARGNSVVINAQIQYRENQSESLNVFPNLGGEAANTLISVPITLTVVRNRVIQTFTVNETHSDAQFTNAFAGVTDAGELAGIQYPDGVAADPLHWECLSLLFSGFTGAAALRPANAQTIG